MSKGNKTQYVCQQCNASFPKWAGKCPECSEWNTLVEQAVAPATAVGPKAAARSWVPLGAASKPQRITEVAGGQQRRSPIGIGELDRALGGGLVPNSFVLITGDPGIGKSTLLLQATGCLARRGPVLYVTAEESTQQVRMRGERLDAMNPDLFLLPETSMEAILERVRELRPSALVIDSIQTIYTTTLESAPGSVSQVRECAAILLKVAKGAEGIPVFLVAHVTKDGTLAGPRTLEHMVDTVLYFEGEKGHPYRILRAVKNRFGSTDEIGVFQMVETGLAEVPCPSEAFLAERLRGTPGSAVIPSVEGTRPILVEVQALVASASGPNPRRTVMGLDSNRVALLAAVLERRGGLNLAGQDIFLNVAGGMRLMEPAADLAAMAALASSHMGKALGDTTMLFGEVGLGGEVRAVSNPELRVREAARLGFTRCLLPASSLKNIKPPGGIEMIGVRTIDETLNGLFS